MYTTLNRVFILQITLACLCAVLLIVLEVSWFGPHSRMNAQSTYNPAPIYEPLDIPGMSQGRSRGGEIQQTHPAIQRSRIEQAPPPVRATHPAAVRENRLQRLLRRLLR